MSNTAESAEIEQGLKRLRLVVFALMGGTLVFGMAVGMLVVAGFDTNPEIAPILLLCLVLLAIGEISAYPVVRRQLLRQAAAGDPGSQAQPEVGGTILAAFTSLTIVGAAMCEGFVLFSLVVFLLTGNAMAILAAALGFVLLAWFLPNREKLRAFAAAAAGHPG